MRGLREQPARVLANRLWKQPGSVLLGEGRFCSEVPARQNAQHAPCPWAAGPRSSWPPVELAHEETGRGECVPTCPGVLQGSAPLGRFLCA